MFFSWGSATYNTYIISQGCGGDVRMPFIQSSDHHRQNPLSYIYRFSFQIIKKLNVQPGEVLTLVDGHGKLQSSNHQYLHCRDDQKGVNLAQQMTAAYSLSGWYTYSAGAEHASRQ